MESIWSGVVRIQEVVCQLFMNRLGSPASNFCPRWACRQILSPTANLPRRNLYWQVPDSGPLHAASFVAEFIGWRDLGQRISDNRATGDDR